MSVSKFLSLFLQILDEIEEQGIKIYELPDCESDEDEDYVEQTKQLKVLKYFTLFLSFQTVCHLQVEQLQH